MSQIGHTFFELCVEKAVFAGLDAADKVSAIRFMVDTVAGRRGLSRGDTEAIFHAVLNREELGSTGVGSGVATPHTRHICVDEVCVGWFVAGRPLDFGAPDGEPTWLFHFLICPPNAPGDHLRILEGVSRVLKDDGFRLAAREGIDRLEAYLYTNKNNTY